MIYWFEIPTTDIERAAKFYGHILARDVSVVRDYGAPMAWLADEGQPPAGTLIQTPDHTPSQTGVVIFIEVKDMEGVLSRVVPAGGQIFRPKTEIGGDGYTAHFADTEGNKIGLWSRE